MIAFAAACRPPQLPRATTGYVTQFDAVWSKYDSIYPAFGYKGITADDWNKQRAHYRPLAASAKTEDEFIAVVREMLAPLKDLHAWFVDPRGELVPTYVPTALENFERDRWRSALKDVGYVAHGTGWGEATIGGFGYLYIGTWNTQQVDINALDIALARFRDAPGLIIDVRPNAGGSDVPAFAFASRFASKPQVVSYVQVRTGNRHDDLGAPEARVIAPRGAWQFTKPVVVLAGRGGFSANESFVAAMSTLPQVTVIGDTTGGASGNPGRFALGNGWWFTVPRWIEYGPDKQAIEWKGIAPSVLVPWTPMLYFSDRDPLIDTAVGMLGERNALDRVAPPGGHLK
ncbi:MAG: S41 family peptidase [Gemmatimonadaceae bacterium]